MKVLLVRQSGMLQNPKSSPSEGGAFLAPARLLVKKDKCFK